MTRRQAERDYSRRIPVSFTMEKDLYDMVDDMIDRKVFKDRSHAINAALDFLRFFVIFLAAFSLAGVSFPANACQAF